MIQSFLRRYTWPIGLQHAFIESCKLIPLRFLIIDDSGSMLTCDGRRVVGRGKATQIEDCTRWTELLDSLKFQAELSHHVSSVLKQF